jgi:hypothetical protein
MEKVMSNFTKGMLLFLSSFVMIVASSCLIAWVHEVAGFGIVFGTISVVGFIVIAVGGIMFFIKDLER